MTARDNGRVLYEGEPLPHFNEVDECAGLDGLMTYRVWTRRWASRSRTRCTTCAGATRIATARRDYVWVFQISGAVPPAHFIGG